MAIVSRIKFNTSNAIPYYLGSITNKRQTTSGKSRNVHAHYILVNQAVAARLGLPKKTSIKTNDVYVNGAIFDTKRKYTDGDGATKTTDAKRYIQKNSKQVELFTGDYVKAEKGKGKEAESYIVGFPSTLTIIEILYFVKKRFPKVKIVRSGTKTYVPKEIKLPADTTATDMGTKEVS